MKIAVLAAALLSITSLTAPLWSPANAQVGIPSPSSWGITSKDLDQLSMEKLIELAGGAANLSAFELAAKSGDPVGMVLSGGAHLLGIGTRKDESKAAQYFQAAAKAGSPRGMYLSGIMFEQGVGVIKSAVEAARYFRLAAEAGNSHGMFALGRLLSDGIGVAKDERAAAGWFKKSADAGNDRAMVAWAYALVSGTGTDLDQAAAMKWYRSAAELGNATAMTQIGILYEAGRGVREDKVAAVEWYRKGAVLGEGEAQFRLARAYMLGMGVAADENEGLQWLRKSAATGYGAANTALAQLPDEPVRSGAAAPVPGAMSTLPAGSAAQWSFVNVDDMIVALPAPVVRRFGQPGFNCSAGTRDGIFVVVPDSINLTDEQYLRPRNIMPPFAIRMAKLYEPLRVASPSPCNGMFKVKVVNRSAAVKCFENIAACADGQPVPPQQYVGLCKDRQGYSIGGECFSGYDVASTTITSSRPTRESIGVAVGPLTLERRRAAIAGAQQQQAAAVSNAAVRAQAAREAFRAQALAGIAPSSLPFVRPVVQEIVKAREHCFSGTTSYIQCKGFSVKRVVPLPLTDADRANGISGRTRVYSSVIWLSTNAGWVDMSFCHNLAAKRGNWQVTGRCQ